MCPILSVIPQHHNCRNTTVATARRLKAPVMAESMAFWSVLLPPKGKEIEQEIESTNNVFSTIHLTGMALGANPSNGPHVIALQYNGTNVVLATLEAPHTRQVKLDIALDQTVQLRNLGDSEVHAYGFQVSSSTPEDEDDDSDEAEEDEEQDDDSDDDYEVDEDEEHARTPRHLRKALALAADTPGSTDLMDTDDGDADDDESDEGEDEDDSEDEDEEGIPSFDELNSDDMVGEADEDESEDDEDEEGEEEEEEEAPTAKVGSKRLPPQTPQPAKAAKIAKQEPPKSAPPKQQPKPEAAKAKEEPKQASKQAAAKQHPKQAAGTKQIPVTANGDAKPQSVPVASDAKAAKGGKPAKEGKEQAQANGKAKESDGKGGKGAEAKGKTQPVKEGKGKEAKATQPSPGGKGVITPANESEFRKALVEVISGNKDGAVPLAQLGSAVKKPGDVSEKLGAYLKKHADVFEVKGDQVTLKKK